MSDEQDEIALVAQAVAGERLALERLLLRHHRALTARIAAAIPTSMQALVSPEDVLQETFTEVFRGIGEFKPTSPESFRGWLSRIADHRVLDAIRAHRAAKRGGGRTSALIATDSNSALALLDLVAIHERTPSRSAAGHEAVSAVRDALAGLQPAYREALQLRYIEGLSVADAAERMGRTERAIHKLCSRGLQRLRESLGEASRFLTRR